MMRKMCIVLLVCFLVAMAAMPVMAAHEEPQIVMQPQSPTYPEYSVASYRVRVTGENLHVTWYLEWLGNTYNLSDNTNAMEPWENFAGESYGGVQEDENTFLYFFSGIMADLDGGYIWCVIEDGHYEVISQKVRISVGSTPFPPVIEDIPSQVTVEQGQEAEIRCLALSPGGSQLSFLWYETDTGKMEDMRAANRGTETTDYMFLDTSEPGTRYYICCVTSTDGGITYSSVVTVTVLPKSEPATTPPTEPTAAPTQPAEKPTEAPTQPGENPTEAPTTATQPSTQPADSTVQSTEPANKPTGPEAPTEGMPEVLEKLKAFWEELTGKLDLSWLPMVLVGVVAAGAGAGIAILILKKKR